jgi:hypothetical protein
MRYFMLLRTFGMTMIGATIGVRLGLIPSLLIMIGFVCYSLSISLEVAGRKV